MPTLPVYGAHVEGRLSEAGGAPEQAMIVTTACGLGTLSEADAYRSLELLKRLPDAVERRNG